MTTKKKSQNTMLPHSLAKVEFYEKYLQRYLPIMSFSRYIKTIHIYDFFCGRGVYDNGGEGSPIRALKTIVNTKKTIPSDTKIILYLNDLSLKSIESVKEYAAQTIPDYEQYCEVRFTTGDAEKLLDDLGYSLLHTKTDERNLLFVDPYGYRLIHKDAIEKIMSNGKTEIILFLPISFMHRFKGYAFEADASSGVAPLRKFIEDFFPVSHPMRLSDVDINVYEYIDYLKEAFTYNGRYYTASYQIERNSGSYFALFFMTSNLRGFEKIMEVKWQLDEEDGNGFSLVKESPQVTLFDDHFANLKKLDHSNRLRVSIIDYLQKPRNNGELFEFVLKKGYMCKHSIGILKQLQEEGRLEVVYTSTGAPVRKGSFYLNYEAVATPKIRFILKY